MIKKEYGSVILGVLLTGIISLSVFLASINSDIQTIDVEINKTNEGLNETNNEVHQLTKDFYGLRDAVMSRDEIDNLGEYLKETTDLKLERLEGDIIEIKSRLDRLESRQEER